jgi:hypothetical protein
MPLERLPESETVYYLVAYDGEGQERTDDPDGLMSKRAVELLSSEPITDVFVASHGWMGAIPDAERQYGKWVGAMAAARADIDRISAARPGFRPLVIGLHWPSKPWGDEEFGGRTSFAPGPGIQALIDSYAERIADTPKARAALAAIFTAAAGNIDQVHPPPEILDAYAVLDEQSDLGGEGPGAAPGADREPFDAERMLRAARQSAVAYGNFNISGLLAPLRALSFWKMKDRGRRIGETAGRDLLRRLQQAAGPAVQFHLMGHSFGCILASSIVAGAEGAEPQILPVHSVALVQGALSLWSYCADIPAMRGRPGYFHGLTEHGRVAGPIITTRSTFDQAVGRFYPLGAGVAHQVAFAPGELPKYGALGSFGAQGPGFRIRDMEMLGAEQPYGFVPRTTYNLDASRYIRYGRGTFGAHSDIAHPEVAHAVWQAALPLEAPAS